MLKAQSQIAAHIGKRVELIPNSRLEVPCPIACDGQLRFFAVLEANIQRASSEQGDLFDPAEIYDRSPMNTRKLPGIQFVFQLRNRVIHAVGPALGDGEGQFVFRVEMGHTDEVEEPEPVSETRGDAVRIFRLCFAQGIRELLEQFLEIGLRKPANFATVRPC